MRIRYLSLTNFRNYARLELTLPGQPLVIYGGNAQGKTSLLEAIYLLAAGSSPLASSDRHLIRWQSEAEGLPYARVWAEVERRDRRLELEVGLEKQIIANGTTRLQKSFRVDRSHRNQSNLAGHLNAVLFTPEDVDLVAGSPSARRRYLDDALCQVDGVYRRALATYSDALRQRNAALRHVRDSRGDPAQLDPFEEELARDGVLITLRRRALIDDLSERVQWMHPRLTGSAEWLRLDYQPSFGFGAPTGESPRGPKEAPGPGWTTGQGAPETDVQTLVGLYRQALTENRREEILRGATAVGPQRDDMRFTAGSPTLGTHEVDLGSYGSRGQQRTAVLSLKIAELGWMRDETRESPLLLLDEVLAELDQRRRALLLEQVNSVEQAILTATDLDMFSTDFLGQAAVWEVKGGIVER